MKKIFLFAVSSMLLVVSGCATIIDGESQQVSFNSNPDGATVLVNGVAVGKTPVSYLMKRGDGNIVTVKKDGYKSVERTLTTQMNGMFFGNIIFGGLFGSTTDSSTGAAYEYEPGQFMFELEKS